MQIDTSKTPEEAALIVDAYVKGLSLEPEAYGFGEIVSAAFAFAMLSFAKEAYIVKSKGGADDQGGTWEPIKQKTIAYSRTRWRDSLSLPGVSHYRPTLTAGQNERWKNIFIKLKYERLGIGSVNRRNVGEIIASRRALLKLNPTMKAADDDASSYAAANAWNNLKAIGAKTLIGMAEKARVDIMVDTGELLEMVSPTGYSVPYSPSEHQEVEIGPGRLRIAINHKKAKAFAARPLWPSNTKPWIMAASAFARDQATDHLAELLR